ncbi:MAG: hypothetical protein QM709_06445 [Spongiibacteraceae bacterium]
MTKHPKLTALCSALTTITAMPLWAAQPVRVDVGAGMEFHSNAALVSEDEESDLVRVARAGIAWADPVGPLSGDINYRADRRDFADDVDEDETAINGNAMLKWDVAPRLLDVIVQHQISRTQTDLSTTNTAGNRERRSVLTGGLDGFLHLSSVDSLIISPRYTEVSFSESTQSDSKRSTGDVIWQHQLDALSKLSVQGGVGRVRFDDSQQDYDSNSAQVAYQTALSRLSYSVSAGVSKFKRDNASDVSGNSLHLSADYRGQGFNVGGNFVRELTDSSIGLSQNTFTIDNFTANDSNFNQVDILQREQLDLYWRQELSAASTLSFSVGGTRDHYKETPRDQDVYYGQIDYRYTVNSFWSLGLLGRAERTRFLDDPQDLEYKSTTYTASVRYRFNPHADAQLSLSRQDRNANLDDRDYTDNVAMIDFTYRFY